jgi:hypothetical protein
MDSYNPRPFLKSGTPRIDGCSSVLYMYFLFFFFFSFFDISADSTYRPPSLYSLMCIIGCSMSIVSHARKILLEMLTVDNYWELDTV